MKLSWQERDELAEALWQSTTPGELSPEHTKELRRRRKTIDSGQVEFLPGDQVMRELRRRFPAIIV
jgi:putative addiction module component (TIGR02574 family)